MQVGLCIDPRLGPDLGAALDLAVVNGIKYVEPGGGGHVPTAHVDPRALARDATALATFREEFTRRGLEIAALGCYGNPVDPDEPRAEAFHEDFVAMCRVAALLGVERVTVISGVPAGGPRDLVPNWITPATFAGLETAYRWQWDERLIPYWRKACAVAEDHGVTICMEPIGRYMVYSPDTFLRLAEACDGRLRASVDPSHLWWQGIDPCVAVERLGDAIAFVQAKDVLFDARRIERHGLLPMCGYAEWDRRTWSYRAVGLGHDDTFWRAFFTALRRAGYDGVVAIEIEEPWLSIPEAVTTSAATLGRTLPVDPMPASNWFDGYEWQDARIQ